ncbi:hypothetical protein C8Q79DRAFT_539045 [Trametes meyenii]|nr:hypothetical protein C8Q79DRAFT_539045 [Trametes meyenii]
MLSVRDADEDPGLGLQATHPGRVLVASRHRPQRIRGSSPRTSRPWPVTDDLSSLHPRADHQGADVRGDDTSIGKLSVHGRPPTRTQNPLPLRTTSSRTPIRAPRSHDHTGYRRGRSYLCNANAKAGRTRVNPGRTSLIHHGTYRTQSDLGAAAPPRTPHGAAQCQWYAGPRVGTSPAKEVPTPRFANPRGPARARVQTRTLTPHGCRTPTPTPLRCAGARASSFKPQPQPQPQPQPRSRSRPPALS